MTRVPALEANVVVRVFVVLVEMAAVGTGKAYNNGYLFCGTTYRGIVDVVVVVVVVIVVVVVQAVFVQAVVLQAVTWAISEGWTFRAIVVIIVVVVVVVITAIDGDKNRRFYG